MKRVVGKEPLDGYTTKTLRYYDDLLREI
jgi:hypothetical protein